VHNIEHTVNKSYQSRSKINEDKNKIVTKMKENFCDFCKSQSRNLLQCSACGIVSYCNQNCQKSHWKIHKKQCSKPYKIVKIPSKGFGLVATRSLSQGDLIIKEKAALILPLKTPTQNKASVLMQQFEMLNEKERDAVLNLHCEKLDTSSLDEKLEDIFSCNCIEIIPINSVALYTTIPRINHSCSPNVIWSWVSGTYNVKEIRAVRNIDPGEELCANYIDSFEGTLSSSEERQNRLRKWNFTCTCQICSLEPDKLMENDKARQSLQLYHQLIPQYMSSWNITKAVETAEKKLQMMESIKDQMWTMMPSTMMELYEMYKIAKVLNHPVKTTEMETIAKKAGDLSVKFGDRFLSDYKEKLAQVELECQQILKARKK